MSYLCDLFFIFRLIFIAINHTNLNRLTCFFVHFLEALLLFLNDSVDEESQNFQMAKVQILCCLDFA